MQPPRFAIVFLSAVLVLPGCVADDEPDRTAPPSSGSTDGIRDGPPTVRLERRAAEAGTPLRQRFSMAAAHDFGAWDRDGEGSVSPLELADGVFERWDTNGDGVLSRVEWRIGAETWFAAEVARGAWKAWDRDGDLSLHRAEFRDAFRRDRLSERIDLDRDGVVSEDEFQLWHLEVFDGDGDGRLGPGEKRKALSAGADAPRTGAVP